MSDWPPNVVYKGDAIAESFALQPTSKGDDMVVFQVQFQGGTRTMRWVFNKGKAEEISRSNLEALGWNGQFGKDSIVEKGAGRDWKLTHNGEYNGQPSEQWNLITPRQLNLKPVSGDKLTRFSAGWRANTGAKPAATKPPVATTKPPAAKVGKGPPPADAYGKNEAWAEWERVHTTPNVDDWKACIEGVGKPESKFDEDDWRNVGKAASIPM